MKHRGKQLLSILLSLALVLGLLPGMTLTASAAVGDVLSEDDYLTFTAEEDGSTVTLGSQYSFTMPTKDVTVTAEFEEATAPQLPDVIKDCTYYNSYYGVYANVPFAEGFNDIQNGALVFDSYSDTEKCIMDTKDYSYKFYDENGTELQAENVYSDDSADGYGFRVIMNVFEFSNPVSGPLYIVATAPAPETFKVYVKKLTGETYTIENLTGETTVAQLKEIIADQIDIPATAQRLIFAGKQLEDAKTLAEYNIVEESTIHLVIRGYTVTWLNYDNSELGTTTVQYGATPSYDGDTPEKAEDENYTYTFSGWSDGSNTYAADALPAVSGDVTYTAVFTADPKTPQLPDVIAGCTYYDSYNGVYANVPFAEEFNDIQNGAIIFDSYSDTEKSIMDTMDYSYKFYDENGTELQAENVYSDDSADGYGYRVIMNVFEFSNPVSGPLYIVATAPTPVGESTFYLVGNFNSWQADEAYALTKNAEAEGEYMLFGVELHKDDALKVLETNSSIPNFEPVWYPGGYNNDYVVPADGIYDIYFRPNYDGGEDWFYSCIYLADVTPELPAFTGKSLSLNGSIGVNFFFTVPDGYDMTGVSFDLAWGEDPHAHTQTVEFSEAMWDVNAGYYRVTANVAAAEMTDTVTVTMKQGEEVLDTDTGSVMTYAQGILSGEKDEYLLNNGFNEGRLAELKDLCQAMLVYGAKSQLQFNYKTENLAADEAMIAELEPLDADEIEALGTMSFPEDFTENCGISYYGCSLLLRSTTTLRLYFTVADQDKLNALTVSLEGETLTCGVNGRLVYFDVADIPAALVFTNRTLYFGDEAVTVNVGAYVRSVLNGSNETLKAAMTALYRYSEAAQAYFVN